MIGNVIGFPKNVPISEDKTFPRSMNAKPAAKKKCNPNKGEKKWIIDVDIKGEEGRAEMIRLIQNLPPNVFVAELETKNGWHLITYPFNLQEYKEVVPHDIQKDNPTILYIS